MLFIDAFYATNTTSLRDVRIFPPCLMRQMPCRLSRSDSVLVARNSNGSVRRVSDAVYIIYIYIRMVQTSARPSTASAPAREALFSRSTLQIRNAKSSVNAEKNFSKWVLANKFPAILSTKMTRKTHRIILMILPLN